ncbi:MAG: efflux RND transporter periplasmic adaptor subunit [Pseudomonadota bacterium]
MKKTIFITLAIATVIAAAVYFLNRRGEEISVKVLTVERGEITSLLSATGKVVSREEAGLGASVSALVTTVLVEEGDRVEKGAVLALLDDREPKEKARGAAASVREAEEKVRQMQRDSLALAMVYAAGGTSRQSVEDARSGLEMARAAANRALAELNGIRITLDKLKVIAPFAGIITRKSINPGEWTTPGVAIFVLSNENSREIEVMVDESDGGLVKTGQEVELTSDAFPGYSWTEQVKEVAPAVRKEGAANSIKVRVGCGEKAPGLKLGQQVDAKIRTAYRADAVKLPFDALVNTGGKSSVAMVKSGVIRFVPVVTGIEDAASVEIVSGISAGEEVILPEGKPRKEGERVKTVIRVPTRP